MRLRGRFTLWFSLAALVPIAAAATITRTVVSRSYQAQYDKERALAVQTMRRELTRVEASVADAVASLASRDHYAGGILVELVKGGGELGADARRRLRQGGSMMRGLGLDLLFVVDGTDTVLHAPHYRPASGEIDPVHHQRAARLGGEAYYTSEPVIEGNQVRTVLAVESARTVVDGQYRLTVTGGRVIGPELLDLVRRPERVDARIVAGGGAVLAPAQDDWFTAADPDRIPLPGPDGAPVAFIEVAASDAELEHLLREVTLASAGIAGAAVLVMLLIAYIISRRMTRDLDELVVGAHAAARGDLDHRVEVRTRDEIGAVATSFNHMLEDLKTSKERLAMAERVAAWQEIARRLAHEIKNPLTPIRMSVETLRKTWSKKHPSFEEIFEESTATVLEETERLKRIVGEFSEFARLPKPSMAPLDLDDVVSSTTGLYQGSVTIVLEQDGALPPIEGDRDQLQQVLLNLLENARDALALRADGGAGGRIVVETRREGDTVRLTVEDNGPGFAPEARDKLFTPYFTTKHGSGGTGLGLAIAHRIVLDHGGRIATGDASSGGARITIILPMAGTELLRSGTGTLS